MEYHIPCDMPEEEKLLALDRIARERFSPSLTLKEWQRQAAKEILSGNDVLLLAPTGGGKSLLFYLYALARPTESIIVVAPLKMLEKNMVQNLTQKGIPAVALNADTISQAHHEGRNIWSECKQGDYRVVLCSPELLAEPSMNELLGHEPFRHNVRLVVVDEAHLIPTWGGDTPGRQAFRRAFNAIGSLRSRLDSDHTVFLGLSATLMPGKPVKTVERSLGFGAQGYKFIRLDCERKNIYIIVRRIREGSGDGTFRDLSWVLQELLDAVENDPRLIPKTIIYVDNISKGWQIVLYLRRLLPASLQSRADEIIRHVHSSTCTTCKDEILALFSDPGGSILRVVVATDVFGCGIDIQDVIRVIIFGTPRDLDSAYQRLGRLARLIEFGWGYIYVNAGLWDKTCTHLGVVDRFQSKRVRVSKESADSNAEPSVCPHFLKVLEAHLQDRCLSKVINDLYENSKSGPEARCQRCSGCVLDKLPEPPAKNAPKRRAPPSMSWLKKSRTRGIGRIKKEATDNARRKLAATVTDLFLSIPVDEVSVFDDPDDFLPESKINELAKRMRDLDTGDMIHRALGNDWKLWDSYGEDLVAEVLRIRGELLTEHEEMRLRGAQVDEGDERERCDVSDPESECEYEEEEELGSEPDSQMQVVENPPPCCSINRPRLILRLRPPQTVNRMET